MKKRLCVVGLLLVVVVALSFATGTKEGAAKPAGTVRWIAFQHTWINAIKPFLPEFEKQTGITVQFESYPDEQQSQKLAVESAAGSPTLDVFGIRPLQDMVQFEKNGWLTPLASFATADTKFNLEDFPKVYRDACSVKGKLVGIPILPEVTFMFYNTEMLKSAGVKVPTTVDELLSAAEKLTDKSREIYGYASRGQRSAAVTQFSPFLYSNGGDWFVNGKATIDTPQAIESFKFYGDILRNYGPPNAVSLAWAGVADLFNQGKVAIAIEGSSQYGTLVDPTKSKVYDKVGIAMVPSGPAGARPYSIVAWELCIGPSSKNKDNAWKLISWLLSKDNMARTERAGSFMARKSAWQDPANNTKFTPEFISVNQKSAEIGVPYDRPVMIKVQQARDIIGNVIAVAIEGGDVAKAAHEANAQFQKLLDEEK
jgi:multiple sugar transport system substrate-binding protein